MITINLYNSTNPKKKYMIKFLNPDTNRWNTLHFGAKYYSDYTIHKSNDRKNNYIKRHSGMGEDWSKTGLYTPGFWSRWLLWEKPSIDNAIKNIEKKFKIKIIHHDSV